MTITHEIITSVAALYTLSELREKLKDAVEQMLNNPERIVSATTGSGASYSKALNMKVEEYVELLSYAMQYKETGEITTGGSNQWHVAAFYPFNL